MTIINSVVQGENAYLITDAAFTDWRDGRILHNGCKFITGNQFPWAMAVTGSAQLPDLVAQVVYRNPRNAKEMVECLPDLLRGVQALRLGDEYDRFTMALRVAAWCEHTSKARVFHIDMDAGRCERWGIAPWEVVEADVFILGTESAPLIRDRGWDEPERVTDPSQFDPVRDGVTLVGWQRDLERWKIHPEGPPLALIGGGVQIARVNREGVAIKTAHVWPEDKVGQIIEPCRKAA
jgi:hypothetical protein